MKLRMWRICRKIILSQWNANRQNAVDSKNKNLYYPKGLVYFPVNEKKRYSSGNHKKKQHADKQNKKCWEGPHFQFKNCRLAILETAGWLGTAAALCINIHLKNVLNHDQSLQVSCLFPRSVLAMPKHSVSSEGSTLSETIPVLLDNNSTSTEADILRTIKGLSDEYVATVQNTVGIASLNRNNKKAFRCFQTAARLGSIEGFYNLGLCYELGKGTRVNLQRAAFCYQKAAMKGHSLACYNLAIYFMKGKGGLPIDHETAKLLLAEAAGKGVTEAQLYLAIELLEKRKWLDAVPIFESLAKQNVPGGQYYLGLCFENGWGVEQNEQMAGRLFFKSASQGNKKATTKLRSYSKENKRYDEKFLMLLNQILKTQNNTNRGDTLVKTGIRQAAAFEMSQKSFIHVSTSVPELTMNLKISPSKYSIPSHLDLMIPFFSVQNAFC